MSSIIIRNMTERDIDDVLTIEEMSFTIPWSRKSFVLEIARNNLARYVVAEIDGKVIGYGGMWLVIDEGHITNIAVHKDYRGLGAGNFLLEGLINICYEIGIIKMTLEVRESNYTAQSLYKKYGFKEFGVRPGYYSDNSEDAIIMWRGI